MAAATGMCGVALGSDGGGSIRYPSALTGLFGIKPQRDRIPLGPDHHDAWNGLTAYGPLARTVRDAAAFLDATADDRAGGRVRRLRSTRRLEPLRIAVSFKPPPGSLARLTDERRAAIEQTAELLRSLGHDVFEQEVDYGPERDVERHRSATSRACSTTSRRWRARNAWSATRAASPRSARRIPDRWLATARAKERAIAARMNRSFDRADVVLTPIAGGPPPTHRRRRRPRSCRGRCTGRNAAAWAVPWNVIGQPAASVPVGFDSDGLPLAVQLCGRPGDEATLLRLAAQLEDAQPWAGLRPLRRLRPPFNGPCALLGARTGP